MSRFDYIYSQKLEADDPPFYALVMAAMRRADSTNAEILKAAYPEVFDELMARYWAPGGLLEGEDE